MLELAPFVVVREENRATEKYCRRAVLKDLRLLLVVLVVLPYGGLVVQIVLDQTCGAVRMEWRVLIVQASRAL